jgi:hypothetical protein
MREQLGATLRKIVAPAGAVWGGLNRLLLIGQRFVRAGVGGAQDRDRHACSVIPMRTIIWFAIESSRREAEICRLEWDDNDATGRTGLVRDAKHPRSKDGNHLRFKYTPVGSPFGRIASMGAVRVCGHCGDGTCGSEPLRQRPDLDAAEVRFAAWIVPLQGERAAA